MDKLEQYRIFVQVAEMGSFIKAAHVLDLPRTSVSAAVQRLETAMGTRLLHRTTRQVRLTADGERLIGHVHELLNNADDIEQLFKTNTKKISGRLNIDVPSRIARKLIAPALPDFFERYPDLQLSLGSSDRAIDLAQEGVDCVIRFGTLYDSRLIVRHLGSIELINCASSAYLDNYGIPQNIDDLKEGHWSVGYASPTTGRETPWEYEDNGQIKTIDMPSRVIVNSAESYIACCVSDLGLIQIPRFDVQDLLDRSQLIEVLPQHRPPAMNVSALYLHRRQRSQRLSCFIDWFERLLKPHTQQID